MELEGFRSLAIPEDKAMICRFCLEISDDMMHMRKFVEQKFEEFENVLLGFGVVVDDSPNLPSNVCQACRKLLDITHTFLQNIKSNQCLLQTLYGQNFFTADSTEVKSDSTEAYSFQDLTESGFETILVTGANEDTTNVKTNDSEFESSDKEDALTELDLEVFGDEEEVDDPPSTFTNVDTESGNYKVSKPGFAKIRGLNKKSPQKRLGRRLGYIPSIQEKKAAARASQEIISITQCSLCPKKFSNPDLNIIHYITHVVDETENTVTHRPFCYFCGLLTENKEELDAHLQEKHEMEDDLNCDDCNIKFSRPHEMLNHYKKDHEERFDETEVKPNKCPICKKEFEKVNELITHSLTHISRRYTCITCKQMYICDAALNDHHREHPQYRYRCKICNRLCAGRNALRQHILTHSLTKDFECDICKKCYKTKHHLKYHRSLHFRANLMCSYCGYSTPLSRDLQMHMRTHSTERPYKCTFKNCTKAYKTNSCLSSHVKMHLNLKKYACDMCDYKTSRNVALSIHKRRHTGEKPYTCRFCLKSFNRQWTLMSHVRKVHNVWETSKMKKLIVK